MALHQRQVPISSKNTHAARHAHARAKQVIRTYDTSAIQPKQSKVPFVVFGVVVIAIACIVAAIIVNSCSVEKVEILSADESATIVIEEGDSARDVANTLVGARLVSDTNSFLDAVDKQDAENSLYAGTYTISGGLSADEVLKAILAGPDAGETLTIPEGYTVASIASAVQEFTGGRITAEAFSAAASNASVYAAEYSFLADAGTNSLEGFLFPKTYPITETDTADSIIREMLDQYAVEISGIDWSYPESCGLSQYDALILASIVEKESNAENMPTVASVFYNRLNSDRPYLESDATMAYVVGHDPTSEEVHADNPYSTYTYSGLPPTPICNPSITAIQAVCLPAETSYLYFYFDEDGNYTFSETYEEHQDAFSE